MLGSVSTIEPPGSVTLGMAGFSLKVSFILEIFSGPRMERDAQWRFFRIPAELPHVDASIIDREVISAGVNRFANGVGHIVSHPSMGDDRPAAEIQSPDIFF